MSDELTPHVLNQEADDRYNAEPGIVVTPGSADQRDMARWEQFPDSKWACGRPGNPYKYRPFPAMLYKAEQHEGKILCQVPPPQRWEYREDRNFIAAEEFHRHWNGRHQLIVQNEEERSRAFESGWRESPEDALKFANGREDEHSQTIAHTNYEDRLMSPAALAEKAAAEEAAGVPLAEVPESRRVRKSR